jgi:hypothetical protein
LRRAVDQDGNVLDILAQSRRDKAAAKRFFRRLMDHLNALRSYQKRGLRRIAAKPGLGRGCRKLTVCVLGRAVIADQSPLIRTTNRVRGDDLHARC